MLRILLTLWFLLLLIFRLLFYFFLFNGVPIISLLYLLIRTELTCLFILILIFMVLVIFKRIFCFLVGLVKLLIKKIVKILKKLLELIKEYLQFFILIFITIIILLVYFYFFLIEFSLAWISFQVIVSLLMLGIFVSFINKYVKHQNGGERNKFYLGLRRFILVYILCESVSEFLFFIGYIFKLNSLFSLLILFKLGVFPFFYYFYLVENIPFKYYHCRHIYLIYSILNEIWSYLLMIVLPVNLWELYILILFSSLFLFIGIRRNIVNLMIRVFLFNNLILIVLVFNSPPAFIFLYIFIINWVKLHSLDIFHFKFFYRIKTISLFSFTIIYGNPIFIFNLVKIYCLSSIIENLGIQLSFLFIFVSIIFLIVSLYSLSLSDFFKFKFKSSIHYFYTGLFLILLVLFLNSTWSNILLIDYLIGSRFYYTPESLFNGIFNSFDYLDYKIIFIDNLCIFVIIIYVFREIFIGLYSSNIIYFSGTLYKDFLIPHLKIKFINFDFYQFLSYTIPLILVVYNLGLNCFFLLNGSYTLFSINGILVISGFQWGWSSVFIYFNSLDKFNVRYYNYYFLDKECSVKEESNSSEIVISGNKDFLINCGGCREAIFLPVNRSIRVIVNSIDVIHSFWIPSLGVKMDSEPGKANSVIINFIGDLGYKCEFYCTEFCGLNHSYMGGCIVMADEVGFSVLSSLEGELFNEIITHFLEDKDFILKDYEINQEEIEEVLKLPRGFKRDYFGCIEISYFNCKEAMVSDDDFEAKRVSFNNVFNLWLELENIKRKDFKFGLIRIYSSEIWTAIFKFNEFDEWVAEGECEIKEKLLKEEKLNVYVGLLNEDELVRFEEEYEELYEINPHDLILGYEEEEEDDDYYEEDESDSEEDIKPLIRIKVNKPIRFEKRDFKYHKSILDF